MTAYVVHFSASTHVGRWVPKDTVVLRDWLDSQLSGPKSQPDRSADSVANGTQKKLSPVIQEFQELIETDVDLYMLFHQMF
ncbi:hypothetical protein HYDPIDRAFT_117606, partial [Hydnomerulius pinastri MD-312]